MIGELTQTLEKTAIANCETELVVSLLPCINHHRICPDPAVVKALV